MNKHEPVVIEKYDIKISNFSVIMTHSGIGNMSLVQMILASVKKKRLGIANLKTYSTFIGTPLLCTKSTECQIETSIVVYKLRECITAQKDKHGLIVYMY